MRPPGLNEQRSPLSRGPSGLPRSGKSGKTEAPPLETTGHLSVGAVGSRFLGKGLPEHDVAVGGEFG
jgi:hypothetical protein